jgi:hypothetical protein
MDLSSKLKYMFPVALIQDTLTKLQIKELFEEQESTQEESTQEESTKKQELPKPMELFSLYGMVFCAFQLFVCVYTIYLFFQCSGDSRKDTPVEFMACCGCPLCYIIYRGFINKCNDQPAVL